MGCSSVKSVNPNEELKSEKGNYYGFYVKKQQDTGRGMRLILNKYWTMSSIFKYELP